MKDLAFLLVSTGVGISVFALIAKKFGSDCIP